MPKAIHRRAWLRLAAAIGWTSVARAGDDAAEVEAKARRAGLAGFGRVESAHYLGLGDAPAGFIEEAVAACEAVAAEFVKHFRDKGFADVAMPAGKLTVVVLADGESYRKFTGEDPDSAVGGHYEPDTNRLVMFDFRGRRGQAATPERLNTIALVHEATHQLTFNTGLLDRRGDVPLCVSEGLAMYGETWRPKSRGKVTIGLVNYPWLKGLEMADREGMPWIALDRLLVEDRLLDDEATRNAARAESWMLVHACLKDPKRLPGFRAYLAAIKGRRDPSHRLDDARAHLGDLGRLNADLRAYKKRPIGN